MHRRTFAGVLLGLPLGLAGCGWEPLNLTPEAGPAADELRAIHVAPIAERVGQRLAVGLRESFNPNGIPTPPRYTLRITLQIIRLDLGIQIQGLGTRGRVDIYATFTLTETATGAVITNGTSHAAESFDILANEYSNVVAEEDARNRCVDELRRDLLSRLIVVLQNRIADQGKK
ncbi:MAG: hypothetical protein JO001_23620 [Alphaproteobacteria bacterium]|nr:hypothetical protein [Alphaproteobacteria bacterium]